VGCSIFYKSAATNGELAKCLGLDVANLIIFISKNGENIPRNHKIFVFIFHFLEKKIVKFRPARRVRELKIQRKNPGSALRGAHCPLSLQSLPWLSAKLIDGALAFPCTTVMAEAEAERKTLELARRTCVSWF